MVNIKTDSAIKWLDETLNKYAMKLYSYLAS